MSLRDDLRALALELNRGDSIDREIAARIDAALAKHPDPEPKHEARKPHPNTMAGRP